MRFDLRIIASWIKPGSTVLDLGCGEGNLLHMLRENRQVRGTGIEQAEPKVTRCIEKGLSVLQGDINREILDYPEQSFDFVVLSQTLQQAYKPDELIQSMLRVGKKAIVSFPNFGHWKVRLMLLVKGHAPVTRELPYQWYDTPNIRVITLKDFIRFSRQVPFQVLREASVNTNGQGRRGTVVKRLANLRATYGIFLIGNKKNKNTAKGVSIR